MILARRKATRPPPIVERRPVGPTPERLLKSDGFVEIGDDKRGGRIYTFRDSTMDRLYSRLTKAAKGRDEEETLRREYTALMKYKHHWHSAGLQSAIGSVDLNRVFASDPGSMSGMAKSEKQAHHRQQYRSAHAFIGHRSAIVLDNVVCSETSLSVAGYAIGYASEYRAREAATMILRECGTALANLWGIG